MRSNTLSTLAFLVSSLLVKDVIAGRYDVRKRAFVTENIVVSEEVFVTKELDGSYVTGLPIAVTTYTAGDVPAAATSAKPSSTLVSVSVAAASSVAASSVAAPSEVSSLPVVSPSSAVAPAPTSTVAPSSTAAPSKASSTEAISPAVSSVSSVAATPSSAVVVAPISTGVVDGGPAKGVTSSAAVFVQKPTTLATVAKSSSVAAAAPSAPAVVSGKKRGLAYNDASLLQAFVPDGKTSWAYNWGYTTSTIPSSLEYVPMLWGPSSDHSSGWSAAATQLVGSGTKYLMSFNEPDMSTANGGSDIDVATAVSGYKQFMQPFAGKAQLGAPAVTNGNQASPPMGLPYLTAFLAACTGCQIDFIPIHWYQSNALADAVTEFQQHVQDAYTAGGNKPVWITEFRYTGSDENSFLQQVIPWLDSQPFVARYSYFMASNGILNSGTGLSTIGATYASV